MPDLMPKKCFCVFIVPLILSTNLFAGTKIWTGAAGDGQWSTSSNWNGNIIPATTDDVLLDNSIMSGNYTVTLPATAVLVKTLTIRPANANSIQMILPATNSMEPAFTATGPGYGLLIENAGIFLNASGLSSGESLAIADSIRIDNGGKYIHQTRASHANNIVRLLSAAPGTENGIFEFDIPRASYTVSVSNRIYGTLVFNAQASGGAIAYTCNGANPLRINGNLQVNSGVNFSVDLQGANGNIFIKGDYIQNGGIFNMASGMANSTVVRIGGRLLQAAGAQITETNSGLPTIELNGSSVQTLSLLGTLDNDICFRMNNPAGAILLSPLRLPYKLELLQGKISTSSVNLLTLANNCSIIVDSTVANSSFIDGPLRKEGLAASPFFLFPVGKDGSLRWLELKNVTGNFVVEYFKNNPRFLSNICGSGISHISSIEYWTLDADASPAPAANIELSFVVPGSGPVTDISWLDVAALSSGTWLDAGHDAVTGTFNTAGSVISHWQADFPASGYFTLASTADLENPLPFTLIDFNAGRLDQQVLLHWAVDLPADLQDFEIMAGNGAAWKTIARMPAVSGTRQYQFISDFLQPGINYYRLRVIDKEGGEYLSRIVSIGNEGPDFAIRLVPVPVIGRSELRVNTAAKQGLQWTIMAMDGRIVKKGSIDMVTGNNTILLDLAGLAAGVYQLTGINEKKQCYSLRFLKQ